MYKFHIIYISYYVAHVIYFIQVLINLSEYSYTKQNISSTVGTNNYSC